MQTIPRDSSLDSTLDVVREGFPFIWNRVRGLHSDIFQIRLMGQRAICLHGPEAAQLFYEPARFVRTGAVPRRIQTTLMGQDAVQTKDGNEHRCRKDAFMSLMTPQSRQTLMQQLAREWQAAAEHWTGQQQIVLFNEVLEVLCRAACAWANVPLPEKDARHRAQDFWAMVDAFGGAGPRHWRGKRARTRTEDWIEGVIKKIRKGKLHVAADSPAHVMAGLRDADGDLLSARMAAIELINVVRPIVAIATYITFAAVALHEYPAYKGLLRTASDDYTEYFVQEVRRDFPFAPFLGARVREDFTWRGCDFKKGTLVLLDVYGLNHDPRLWPEPNVFWPDRFRNRPISPYDFIPQGGGHYSGHRCAGEWITIEALKQAVTFLNDGITYDVPAQDLRYDLTRMPTLPASGFLMRHVRITGQPAPTAVQTSACPFHH
ncbi:cytochrome P450 [Hymenobacter cellulosilyticus]|uniref:Cytochrome P450 n=1 Tax=Hymenobacter cellulosilyticus TaxID=2932248 RepID=A0A8T9QG00_9BACT|nr:cytochrome P450 [Hymenobacter cellulosilyticus]UOQ74489.1 cytochrome P450 [Hymenobacter cellulosilyticus]